jgi:hypothetical protein
LEHIIKLQAIFERLREKERERERRKSLLSINTGVLA